MSHDHTACPGAHVQSRSGASRRDFLKVSAALGGLAALGGWPLPRVFAAAAAPAAAPSAGPVGAPVLAAPAARVALTTGANRIDNVLRALRTFEKEVASAIGTRRIVIKPNNVAIDRQLAATHADCLEGVLEFLKSIGKLENAVIAESAGNGASLTGFDNYGYPKVAGKYGVKLLDLDREGFEVLHVFDDRDFRPKAVRMSKVLLDPNTFIISAAKPKTHDRVIATLSLKNIIFGAPIKDPGAVFGGGPNGGRSDKPVAHGGGVRGINFNLFTLAQRLHPHLSVLDGFDGMEGNGPMFGQKVDHQVCVVSPDWLAADRVTVELMGIDFAKVGYLNYCAGAGMGQADLQKIEVVGEPIAAHVKPYKLSDNIEQQLMWMKPPGKA